MNSDSATSKKDIFDKESLLKIWIDERRSRDNSADLMWENLKFFASLISAIITANAFFLQLTVQNKSFWYSLASLVLPILIISLSLCGKSDLKRRWSRTVEAIAHLSKLEGLVGIRGTIPKDRRVVFGKDDQIFQMYFNNTKDIDSEEDFIRKNVNKPFLSWHRNEPNMYTAMRRVYVILVIIGAFLFSFSVSHIVFIVCQCFQ